MDFERRRRVVAAILAVVTVASMMTVPLAVSAQKPNPAAVPDDQVIEVDADLSVWERAIYPLRSDNTVATTTVEPPDLRAEGTGIGEKQLVFTQGGERNPIGIFKTGTTINLDFERLRAAGPSTLTNQDNVQLLVARMNNNSQVPLTVSGLIDLTDPATANPIASFEMINDDTTLDGDGDIAFDYTPSQPGRYVVFVAVNETGQAGYQVSGGSLSQTGNITVLGAQPVLVQQAKSSVTAPSSVTRGNDASFDVDASGAFASGDSVTHVLVIYKKGTFTDSIQRLSVDPAQLDANFNIENDATLESSIARTNGEVDIDSGVSLNGVSLSDTQVTKATGIVSVIDFLAASLQGNAPSVTRISPESTLHVSVRATAGASRTTTLTIGTRSNFSTGTYQWVHLAKLDSSENIRAANSGTFSVKAPSTQQPSGPSGGSGGGGADEEEDTATPEEDTATPEEDTATPEEDTATPEEDTATPEEDTATPEEETEESPDEDEEEQQTTERPTTQPPTESPGQPGFGLVIALVALLASAGLAVRCSGRER